MTDYFRALRPRQWIKNLFIFAALFFSKKVFQFELTILYLISFGLFCLLSSSIYIINDIADRERDKLHPVKKNRPIAAGRISITQALHLFAFLAIGPLACAWFINYKFFCISLLYFILNILYSFFLKRLVIVDIFCIALGFVLRVMAGSVIGDIDISNWIIICTFMLSLFLGFTKRRHELILLNDQANCHRPILLEYSTYFLDQMIGVVTASTVVFYTLYTVADTTVENFHTDKLLYTVFFVVYGIFRYLYLVYKKELGGNPTIALLTDGPLIVNVLLWIVSVGIIIYF